MAKLILRSIEKIFDETTAVTAFDLIVGDGEFVTLLGPSGCGKTTTLRMIAGFIRPSAGEIFLGDKPLSTSGTFLPPEARNMGMVFQSYAVWPHKNVFENIAYPLRLRRVDRARMREQVERALDMVNLGGFGKRFPHQLSGGQQQRVALARALVMEPDVLLLDEPLSNLDAKLRERMRFEIVDLQKRLDITVVYVTHDQAEAMAMSDRVVIMDAGRIQQVGAPEAVYESPRNRFVADFVGVANMLEGRVIGQANGLAQVLVPPLANVTVQARYDGALPSGDATLIIRPEAVVLRAGDSEGITGVVQQRLFQGDHVDYQVRVGDAMLRVQAPPTVSFGASETVKVTIEQARLVAQSGQSHQNSR